jgi:thioredoxin-related protein
MKIIVAALLMPFIFLSHAIWLTNFSQAQKIAANKHQLILLNFSGSDWCGNCIRLRKEIFESENFVQFADSNLILVNADFPRNAKNQLSAEQTKLNDALADKYNPDGNFPYTLLLDANGRVLKTWNGFPDVDSMGFINELKNVCTLYKE